MSQHKLIPARVSAGNFVVSGTLTVGGQILAADGTAAAPSISFASDPDNGLYRYAANTVGIAAAGALAAYIDSAPSINVVSVNGGGFNQYSAASGAQSVFSMGLTATLAFVQSTSAGGGTTRPLTFWTGATERWRIDTNGHLIGGADNTYDIGASGATRPRSVYVGTNITVGGQVIVAAGSNGAPSIAILGNLDTGMYFPASNRVGFVVDAVRTLGMEANGLLMTSDGTYCWTDGATDITSSFPATRLQRAASAVVRVINSLIVGSASALGTSGVGVLALGNMTVPSTSPADMVQLFSVDISAGNASLGLRTETAVAIDAALVSTHSLSITINGTVYRMLLAT